jgi:oligopeptidase B
MIPKPKKIPHKTEIHGETLIDEYFWLREKKNTEVVGYINEENIYCKKKLKPYKKIEEEIFEELKIRMVEEDTSVPYKSRDYYYYSKSEKGKNYPLHFRKDPSGQEELLIDVNELSKGRKHCNFGNYFIDSSQKLMAYTVDFDGDEKYEVFVLDLASKKVISRPLSNTSGNITWFENSNSFLYITLNENDRPSDVFLHRLGNEQKDDKLVYHEDSEELFIQTYKTTDLNKIIIMGHGSISNDLHWLDSFDPDFNPVKMIPFKKGHEYYADHGSGAFYILSNKDCENFTLYKSFDGTEWEAIIHGSEKLYLEDFRLNKNGVFILERVDGNRQIRCLFHSSELEKVFEFDDESYYITFEKK